MEGLLPFHRLCHSQYRSLPTLHTLRSLFLIFAISILSPASSSQACPQFKCGDSPPFPYPFGQFNSGCGDPTLQLDCDDAYKVLINIDGYQYYITDLSNWQKDHIMKIMDKNIWGKTCNPSLFSNQTSEILHETRFSNYDRYLNLTIWEQCSDAVKDTNLGYPFLCNETWYLSSKSYSILESMCKPLVTLQVATQGPAIQEGFRVKWEPNKTCTDCMSGGGFCAYKTPGSTQIYCKPPKGNSQTLKIGLGEHPCRIKSLPFLIYLGEELSFPLRLHFIFQINLSHLCIRL